MRTLNAFVKPFSLMLGVLDAINKSKPHDCERNLSPMILIGNQMAKRA